MIYLIKKQYSLFLLKNYLRNVNIQAENAYAQFTEIIISILLFQTYEVCEHTLKTSVHSRKRSNGEMCAAAESSRQNRTEQKNRIDGTSFYLGGCPRSYTTIQLICEYCASRFFFSYFGG